MLGLYVDSALVAKFQQACAYYGQTMTSAVTLFIEETVQEYEELLDFADYLGVEEYFWQEGGACQESFIPPFDLTGVR